MKKMIIGVITAALIAIPATVFAAPTGRTAVLAVESQTESLGSCCVGRTAPCCTINGGGNCCVN